jgi:hypothetical protein
MKYLVQILTIILILFLISCAKQSTPTGGPRDEIAPELMSFTPKNESTNIKPSTIELEFNEYVALENPNKQIIITPRIKKEEMEVTANRNRVIVKLNQELEDSTTYVFNFQKSIKDITEGNAPENLKLVFSTGPDIDSLTFSGNVSYVFHQRSEKLSDIYVGLYEVYDTTDVLTAPPYYIGATDSVGNFKLTNIKSGAYRAYAWHDDNNSLKAEEKQEAYSFLLDSINIDKDVTGTQFYLSKADISEFKINRSSSIGTYFDVVLSKFPVDMEITHAALNDELFFRRNEKTIRFYHRTLRNDSTAIELFLKDSTGLKLDTLLYAKFEESDRRKEDLETKIGGKKSFIDNLTAELTFNKPIYAINYDSLYIKYDTATIIPIEKEWVYFKDSVNRTALNISWAIPDTIQQETFIFYAADSTFLDVDSTFNKEKVETSFKRLNKETLSDEINIKVNTVELPIIIQILTKRDEIIEERYLEEKNEITLNYVEPGTYYIRAIIDRNKNRRWDTSNILQDRYAEPVYYLENEADENSRDITIRGGWTLDLTIEPIKPQGLNLTNKEEKEKKDVDNP